MICQRPFKVRKCYLPFKQPCLFMPFFFFHLPKVPCDAATTCNGHGTCTDDGDCKCDDSFYEADCSGKFSLKCPR